VPPPDRDRAALGVIVTERIAVVGGGIAGASAAYFLVEAAPDSEVVLLEAEEHLAMHTTGRSAALLLENDGTRSIRSLVRASVDFLRGPPEELVDIEPRIDAPVAQPTADRRPAKRGCVGVVEDPTRMVQEHPRRGVSCVLELTKPGLIS
jgi:glycine/D-amino acid oxidase-like deaminating enzyme